MFQNKCRRSGSALRGRRTGLFLLTLLAVLLLAGCGMVSATGVSAKGAKGVSTAEIPDEHGSYTSRDEVALYIHTYGHLPDNYITKREAEDMGWRSGVTLDKAAPGMSIGGSRFGNREGLLPEKKGRIYYECDIDYVKGSRNAKRIVYSNDGLIFYTDDHYNSFEQLY